MYIISGRGRKSGVARATGATASLAPMPICLYWEGLDDLSLKTRGPPLSPEQEPEPNCKLNHSDFFEYCL